MFVLLYLESILRELSFFLPLLLKRCQQMRLSLDRSGLVALHYIIAGEECTTTVNVREWKQNQTRLLQVFCHLCGRHCVHIPLCLHFCS